MVSFMVFTASVRKSLDPPTYQSCLSPILFNLYSECLTKEALEGFGDFKIGGQIIQSLQYAGDLVLRAEEEKVLQDMIDKLTEIGRC
jgi:hypothetical protein